MKKFLYIVWIVFSCGFVALQADEPPTVPPSESPTPSPTPNPTPTPPPPTHFVGQNSSYHIGCGVSALAYCAFLRTKAANEDVGMFSESQYWDSVFMSASTSSMNKNCCVVRTGSNGNYTYSVPIGRENYVIMGLTSQTAFNQLNSWNKNAQAIEMRNYINNKIAEQVTHDSTYADNAYRISSLYPYCSPATFFNGEGDGLNDGINDGLPPGLDGIVNALLNTDNPVAFDANDRITFCLVDLDAGENLIYFDKTVAPEGSEQDIDFNLLPNDKMTVCAHLYNTDPYIPYYRPNGIHRISLAPTN